MIPTLTANKRNTVRVSANNPVLSDMARLDVYEIQPLEYDEQTLPDGDVAAGLLEIAGVPARRGRPVKADRKLSTKLRFDPRAIG